MQAVTISLTQVSQVRQFVNLVGQAPFDVDVVSGRYTVNAKSMLGIYSLDLSKPIQVVMYSDDCEQLKEELRELMAQHPEAKCSMGRAAICRLLRKKLSGGAVHPKPGANVAASGHQQQAKGKIISEGQNENSPLRFTGQVPASRRGLVTLLFKPYFLDFFAFAQKTPHFRAAFFAVHLFINTFWWTLTDLNR